jgi:hypothetical protein
MLAFASFFILITLKKQPDAKSASGCFFIKINKEWVK